MRQTTFFTVSLLLHCKELSLPATCACATLLPDECGSTVCVQFFLCSRLPRFRNEVSILISICRRRHSASHCFACLTASK